MADDTDKKYSSSSSSSPSSSSASVELEYSPPVELFPDGYATWQPLPKGIVNAYTVLHIGGSKSNYAMFNLSGGSQNARLQVEASVDGSLYAIGVKGGIGRYQMSFYDGPFKNCNSSNGFKVPSSIMKKYISLKTVSQREATVYIYRGGSSSALAGKFSGLLNNMASQLVDAGGLVYLQVTLDVLGSWT